MKKVLVVEDDTNIAAALRVRLEYAGYLVSAAYDAVTAPTIASKEEPDLIIMDISMPGGTGFTVAERLKSIANCADVPIIYITASKKNGLLEKAIENGACAYFEKPYVAQELMASVSMLIDKHSVSAAQLNS